MTANIKLTSLRKISHLIK